MWWAIVALSLAIPVVAAADDAVEASAAARSCAAAGPADAPRVMTTTLAGVPARMRIPATVSAPPIVLWHGFGPPQGEDALMALLPLDDVPSVKVYLGLPMFGARAPADTDSLAKRQAQDLATGVFEPVVMGAARELPRVVDALRDMGCLHPGQGIGLFGFSAGGAAALFALAEREVPIERAVVLNASTGLTASVAAYERASGRRYRWTSASRAIASRSDAIGRTADIAAGTPPPALLIVHGTGDVMLAGDAARELHGALLPRYAAARQPARLRLELVEGLAHAAQTPAEVARVRALVGEWFSRRDARLQIGQASNGDADGADAGARTGARVIGGYFPGGEAARYPVSRIPAARLTHLFYAFATIDEGRCAEPGVEAATHFEALAGLKRQHPALRTLISIGGWNAGGFSDAASTARARRRFVASCLSLFFDNHRGSFDGVDIDWEYPVYGGPAQIGARPQDRRNMTLLAREFRRQLAALGGRRKQSFLLTAALPAGRLQSTGPYDPARSYELAELAEVLDFINLMTYDMGTAFSQVSSFNAPLHEVADDPLGQPMRRWNNVAGAIDYYLQQGVPAHKLVLGVPFYGRGFLVSSTANHGLYQPYAATFDPGSWREIKANLLPDPDWERHRHPVARSPWLFHRGQRKFVSYEDPASIAIRARLARDRGLRGVFMWELTGDDAAHGLLEAMAQPFE